MSSLSARRPWQRLLVSSLALVLATAACQSAAPSGSPTAAQPSASTSANATTPAEGTAVLKIALLNFPTDLVGADGGAGNYKLYHWIYDPLVRIGPDASIQPAIAVAWRYLDSKTLEMDLAPNATFHDGTPLTAEDVKFTLEWNLNPDNKRFAGGRIKSLESVEVVDAHQVRLHLSSPDALLLGNLALNWILSKAYIDKVGWEGYNANPIGSGPFKLAEFRAGEYYRFERNEAYFGTKPLLKGIEAFIRKEESTRVAALETGEVDVAEYLPVEQIDRLTAAGFTVENAFIGQVVTFDLWGGSAGTGTSPHPALSKKEVREALFYAVDRAKIHEAFFGGRSRLVECGNVGPDAFGYDPKNASDFARPYKPEKAKELLASAGFPDGFDMVLNGGLGDLSKEHEIVESVAQYLNAVGIRTTLKFPDENTWLDGFFAGTLSDAYLNVWNYFQAMDQGSAIVRFPSSSSSHLWSTPEFDQLYAAQLESTDRSQRQELLGKIQQIFCDDAVMMPLFQNQIAYGFSSKVTGLTFYPDLNWGIATANVSR